MDKIDTEHPLRGEIAGLVEGK